MFVLQLSAADFNDTAVCLGPQVASVMDALVALPELSNVAWYAASLDAVGSVEAREAFERYETEPEKINEMAHFLSLVRRTGQFLDGVFFAVPAGDTPVVAVDLITADGPIEKLVANGIVQICAFDTSWIEIGTDNEGMIQHMQLRFGKIVEDAANG